MHTKAKTIERVPLVTFGRGGHTMYCRRRVEPWGSSSSRLEGYDSPEEFDAASREGYDCEGARVVDTRPAVATSAGYRWVFAGPLVDVDLEPGAVEACPAPSNALVFGLSSSSRQYAACLAMQSAHGYGRSEPGPLDSVDVETWAAGWREHGARIGRIVNGAIAWEG